MSEHPDSNSATAATRIIEYSYDFANRWVRKVLDTNADGTTDASRVFVYDGNQISLQFDKTGAADVVAADLTHRYLWGTAVDQSLADEQVTSLQTPGTVLWPLTDNLGSVRDVIDSAGVVQIHRIYNAFGKMTETPGATVTFLFGFTARPFDFDTMLQNNLWRWYEALTGRWTSEDPIVFEAGDPNLYRYVNNAPTLAIDPTGQWEYKPPKGSYHTEQGIFEAEQGDTFIGLVQEINRLRSKKGKKKLDLKANQYVVRPRPMMYLGDGEPGAHPDDMRADWQKGQPTLCGYYDAKNLLDLLPTGGPIKASVGNDSNQYIVKMNIFYKISKKNQTGKQVKQLIIDESGEGTKPLESLLLVGHSGIGANLIGAQQGGTRFDLSTLGRGGAIYKRRNWADAVAGKMPVVGWFRTDAEVRFAGCYTSKLAENFANNFLRGEAVAWGTTKMIIPVPGVQVGWGEWREGREVIFSQTFAKTPEKFHTNEWAKKYWKDFEAGK